VENDEAVDVPETQGYILGGVHEDVEGLVIWVGEDDVTFVADEDEEPPAPFTGREPELIVPPVDLIDCQVPEWSEYVYSEPVE
jgi:hypothetical protein